MARRRRREPVGKKEEPISKNDAQDDAPEIDPQEKIRRLEEEIERLKKENERLEEENDIFRKFIGSKGLDADAALEGYKELLRKANMNSSNSSKPPSSDGYNKPAPKSRRERTGKKRGGQPGHKGHHMPLPHAPDEVVLHHPERCKGCAHLEECSKAGFSCQESRYVVDIVMSSKVTEHRALRAERCPLSDEPATGSFPEDVKAHIQYGDSVAVVSGILSTHGAVSDSRISAIMRSMFDITISPGTVVSMVSRCSGKVSGALEGIRKALVASDVCDFDETGARIDGRLGWVHCSCTDRYTLLTMSMKRGMDGMTGNGVLPEFKGTAVHDFWSPYWRFDGMAHGTCGAHLLRELTGIKEMEPGHRWPSMMIGHLMFMKAAKEQAQSEGRSALRPDSMRWLEGEYGRILDLADEECPAPPDPPVRKRGRRKLGRERSLIERFRSYEKDICRFVHDFRVPFDNNQAERDVRNVKTKVKVSGCFRSEKGMRSYLGITSYLSTARKHGIDPFKALASAFKGQAHIVLEGS